MTDKQLKQAILFAGIVSFFLGKAALNGSDEPAKEPGPPPDPLLRSLRAAGVV